MQSLGFKPRKVKCNNQRPNAKPSPTEDRHRGTKLFLTFILLDKI